LDAIKKPELETHPGRALGGAFTATLDFVKLRQEQPHLYFGRDTEGGAENIPQDSQSNQHVIKVADHETRLGFVIPHLRSYSSRVSDFVRFPGPSFRIAAVRRMDSADGNPYLGAENV
jgi:hypothetical protein